jgi:hypothetical protein
MPLLQAGRRESLSDDPAGATARHQPQRPLWARVQEPIGNGGGAVPDKAQSGTRRQLLPFCLTVTIGVAALLGEVLLPFECLGWGNHLPVATGVLLK